MVRIADSSSSDDSAIILYQTADGQTSLDVRLQEETVWLSLTQMAELFDRDKSVISRHLRNIFREGELVRAAVVAKNATTAADGKTYQVEYYNLDAIISVGYRVNSKRGTQFRIWASSVLKEYLIKGYALNQRRLAERGVAKVRGVLDLLAATLEQYELADAAGLAVLELVRRYGLSWQLLLQYDEYRLAPCDSETTLLNTRQSAKGIRALYRRPNAGCGLKQRWQQAHRLLSFLSPSAGMRADRDGPLRQQGAGDVGTACRLLRSSSKEGAYPVDYHSAGRNRGGQEKKVRCFDGAICKKYILPLEKS